MKKVVFWIFSFSLLTLFTLSSIGNVFGIGTGTAYAETISDRGFYDKDKRYFIVGRDDDKKGVFDKFQKLQEDEEICALTPEQVAELDAFFKVKTTELKIHGDIVTIAGVSGHHLTKRQLMDYLRVNDASLDCRIVKKRRVFLFPVLPQIS